MRVAVVVFPGTNCEQDVIRVYGDLLKGDTFRVWHRDRDLGGADLVVLPGGFSYGDYLRTGALAKLSPIMESVREFAARGGRVLGICNGFQILCEAGLLPGVLLENVGRRFISQFVRMRVERSSSFLGKNFSEGMIVTCPIAHFQGNYYADQGTLQELEDNGQVAFRYCDSEGRVDPTNLGSNVNGSCNSIAGISNREGNVVGLMPHPERAVEKVAGFIGGDSGLSLFRGAPCGL